MGSMRIVNGKMFQRGHFGASCDSGSNRTVNRFMWLFGTNNYGVVESHTRWVMLVILSHITLDLLMKDQWYLKMDSTPAILHLIIHHGLLHPGMAIVPYGVVHNQDGSC